MAFTMRTTKPGKGNKYYIRKAEGGWSPCIKGKPTDSECNVLSNCVGYAVGRFNEIGGYGYCKYLASVNAENFIQYKNTSLKVGQTPKVGACMVWQKGRTLSNADGAGHVAIVERVDSPTQVYTSESGWESKPFWNRTRAKGSDGNWGQNSTYKFLGFIYNPAVPDTVTVKPSSSSTSSSTSTALKAGDIVSIAPNATYWGGGAIPSWVKAQNWIVQSVGSNGRVIINQNEKKNTSIMSPIDKKFLTKKGASSSKSTSTSTFKPYNVKVTASALNYRSGPGTNYKINGVIKNRGIYSIVAEKKDAAGHTWGKLQSGGGWIDLSYTKKI